MDAGAVNERRYIQIVNRQRRLPEQIALTRQKLSDLINEAERYGMLDEITNSAFNGDLIALERSRR
jgi:hypothetical protein